MATTSAATVCHPSKALPPVFTRAGSHPPHCPHPPFYCVLQPVAALDAAAVAEGPGDNGLLFQWMGFGDFKALEKARAQQGRKARAAQRLQQLE